MRISKVGDATQTVIPRWDPPLYPSLARFFRDCQQYLPRLSGCPEMLLVSGFIPQPEMKTEASGRSIEQIWRGIRKAGNPLPSVGRPDNQLLIFEDLTST